MMSIAALGSGHAAQSYCIATTREDYYTKGGDPLASWWGIGAAEVGLAGRVQDKDFAALLAGRHPIEERALTGVGAGPAQHRAGWDCTFSAPKSVSVVWALSAGSDRAAILRAHERAVAAALEYLEAKAAVTRRGHGGQEEEAVKGLIAARFQHFTSRAGDPQLHTHCIVMNVAPRHDGSFGTIESRHLFEHKMAAGAVFRLALADELVRIGYRVERTKHGFELEGVSPVVREHFSKRRRQIEGVLQEQGTSSAHASQIAALASRPEKVEGSLAERMAAWTKEAESLEANLPRRSTLLVPKAGVTLDRVLEQLSLSHSTFTERDLVRAAADDFVGRATAEQVYEAIADARKTGRLVRLSDGNEVRYTTPEILATETRCLQTALALAGRREHQLRAADVATTVANYEASNAIRLTPEQAAAVRHLAVETGAIALVQGFAGTGKTQMLAAARDVFHGSGHELIGCSLSAKAAQNLEAGSGIASSTLHRLLADLDSNRRKLSAKSIVVADEAGMVGSAMMLRLLAHVQKAGAKVVLVGDARQLQPIDAGQIFQTLLNNLSSTELTDIRRQTEAWAREAVLAARIGDSAAVLRAFHEHGRLRESSTPIESLSVLTSDWLADALPADKKLIVTGTRLDAYRANQAVREALAVAGRLKGQAQAVLCEAGAEREFREGDRILFLRNDLGIGVLNGTLGTLAEWRTHGVEQVAIVRLDDGKRVEVPTNTYRHLDHGYALTVHKAQGTTVDGNVYVLASEAMSDREWSYVALSRAKRQTLLYSNGADLRQLERGMARSHQKTTSLDYDFEKNR